MTLFDVTQISIDGGSLRCYVSMNKKCKVSSNVKQILELEEEYNLYSIEKLKDFSKSVQRQKSELLRLLFDLKSKGKTIVGVGSLQKVDFHTIQKNKFFSLLIHFDLY